MIKMCNINILLRNNTDKNIKGFIQSVTAYSFINNNNGEGIYTNYKDKLIKSKTKIDYTQIREIDKSKVIITHQRLSTSGHDLKYNHPFINKDFVLVHNGIINQFKKSYGSDTFGFWLDFNKEFNILIKNKKIDRNTAIKDTIKKLFKEDIGSYSIFIYDKKDNISYYFKDSGTTIHFYKSSNYWFITTSMYNDEFLTMLGERFKEYKIEDRQIYKLKDFVLFNCDKLPKTTHNTDFLITPVPSEIKPDNTTMTNIVQSKDLEDYLIYDNSTLDDFIYCNTCNKLIHGGVYLLNNNIACEECLSNHIFNFKSNDSIENKPSYKDYIN